MHSQRFLLCQASTVIQENQNAAASNSSGCINIGRAVPRIADKKVTWPMGYAHHSSDAKNRIRNARKKYSSITGTTKINPTPRTAKYISIPKVFPFSSIKGLNAERVPDPKTPSNRKDSSNGWSVDCSHSKLHKAIQRMPPIIPKAIPFHPMDRISGLYSGHTKQTATKVINNFPA